MLPVRHRQHPITLFGDAAYWVMMGALVAVLTVWVVLVRRP